MSNRVSTWLRVERRATELGYGSVEACVRDRIGAGYTVSTLALQLDISQQWLKGFMDKIGVKGKHRRGEKCFWGYHRSEDLFK